MADLNPEERAGLRQVGWLGKRTDGGEEMGPWERDVDGTPRAPLYTLDADRLAELVRRYDEAVALLRESHGINHISGDYNPDCCALSAFLAALGEVPK